MRSRRRLVAVSLGLSLLAAVALLELGLRVHRRLAGDGKPAGALDYLDVWRSGGLGPGGYLKEGFDARVIDGLGGTVRWTNNAAGFRADREFAPKPAPGVLRVLSLGDSFTAGYRVDQTQTYSFLWQQELERQGRAAEVLVSCIEEPVTGLAYLLRHGAAWQPHLVVLGLTLGNDLAQAYIGLDPNGPWQLHEPGGSIGLAERTGQERIGFRHGLEGHEVPVSCLHLRRRPRHWAERLLLVRLLEDRLSAFVPGEAIGSWYGGYYLRPKLFDPIHGLGFFLKEPPEIVETGYQRLFRILVEYQRFCASRGIRFAVVLFPQRFQVQPADWSKTVTAYGLRESCFDLRRPNERIAELCRSEGIVCIDPTDAMAQQAAGRALYLPRGDMHWNAEGHRAFFQATRGHFARLLEGIPAP